MSIEHTSDHKPSFILDGTPQAMAAILREMQQNNQTTMNSRTFLELLQGEMSIVPVLSHENGNTNTPLTDKLQNLLSRIADHGITTISLETSTTKHFSLAQLLEESIAGYKLRSELTLNFL